MSTTAEGSESDGSVPETVDFSRSGIRDGFLTCVPVALGIVVAAAKTDGILPALATGVGAVVAFRLVGL
jgi:hypothetical protein